MGHNRPSYPRGEGGGRGGGQFMPAEAHNLRAGVILEGSSMGQSEDSLLRTHYAAHFE